MSTDSKFFNAITELVHTHEFVIDRRRGSAHPKYSDYIYPHDYGYLAGTTAADGGGIDCWQGSQTNQLPVVTGVIVTIDTAKSDAEMKILINCTETDMSEILERHNRFTMSGILIRNSNATQ